VHADRDHYTESTYKGKSIRLYLVRGAPEDFAYSPRVRKEIEAIQFFDVAELPTNYQNATNKFWAVQNFTPKMLRWIKDQRKQDGHGSRRADSRPGLRPDSRPDSRGQRSPSPGSSKRPGGAPSPARASPAVRLVESVVQGSPGPAKRSQPQPQSQSQPQPQHSQSVPAQSKLVAELAPQAAKELAPARPDSRFHLDIAKVMAAMAPYLCQ
jgi:hypothetical protein